MNQRPPRLQHYVPQFLLRRFARADGNVWAYDTVQRKMFCAAPKGLAAEGYFYGPNTARATPQSTAIETWLANEVEAPGAEAIAALISRAKLSGQQTAAFFRFVAAQMQRTPTMLQRAADCAAPVFQESAERMMKYDQGFRQKVVAKVHGTGATEADLAEFVRMLDEATFTVTPTREFAIANALSIMDLVVGQLAKMRWEFVEVPVTDGDLIIGDHPITLADVRGEDHWAGPLGLTNPHIELALPLSSRVVALAHWDGPICYGELAPGTAASLNERTLSQIKRFAYGSFQSDELLARAMALHGTGPKMRNHRMQIGEKLIMVSEFR